MTNMERKGKKMIYKRGIRLLAVAAVTATLVGGQVQGVFAQANTEETMEEQTSILPENITIEEPLPLSEIGLPESEYGTLSWSDSSQVPEERVQSYEVVLDPFDEVDLSQYEGWDEENGVLVGYVTVVVSSICEPEYTEEPEISGEPSDSVNSSTTITPGVSLSPTVSQIPETGENAQENEDSLQPENSSENAALSDEETAEVGQAEIGADTGAVVPNVSEAPVENIFDQPDEVFEEDNRSVAVEENLSSEEQLARAAENHSCNGISVSGISLPWYVQFRVSSGDEYEFTNESDANIFKSYEFELWDLSTDTEYEIPDGEYISVIVPVKEGYDYTIEHLLDNGAIETIIPSVEGNTMIFSTHSFSPFGIAGSKPLVGEDIAEESYSESEEQTTEISISPAGSSNTVSTGGSSQVTAEDETDSSESSETSTASSSDTAQATSSNGAVETGDTTTILPFVIIAVIAVILIVGVVVVVFMKKRK